jgi:hypothetical protein
MGNNRRQHQVLTAPVVQTIAPGQDHTDQTVPETQSAVWRADINDLLETHQNGEDVL